MGSTPLAPYTGGCTCDAPRAPISPECPTIQVRSVGRPGCTCQPFPKADGLASVAWKFATPLDRRIMVARSMLVGSHEERRALEAIVHAEFPADEVRAFRRRECRDRLSAIARCGVGRYAVEALAHAREEWPDLYLECEAELAASGAS